MTGLPSKTSTSDVIAEQLLDRLARLHKHLRQTKLPSPMTPERISTLSALVQSGPVSLTALAKTENVRPATMSRMVTALDEENFVCRRENKEDGRGVLVAITPKGRRAYERARQLQLKQLTDALDTLPRAQAASLKALVDLLSQLSAAIGPK